MAETLWFLNLASVDISLINLPVNYLLAKKNFIARFLINMFV